MAKIKNNVIMQSISGMIGKQVIFKTRAGKMYVSAAPDIDENRVPTKAQQAARDNFKRCSEYAKSAVEDRETKQAYLTFAQPGQTAYNIALKDAFNPPEVVSVVTKGYQGAEGNIIIVQARDDFKVASVKVTIYNTENELVEEGLAIADAGNWIYIAVKSNTSAAKIIATAIDLPGNEGSLEVMLN